MQVGPLARMLVAYARGHKDVKEIVDEVLEKLDVGPAGALLDAGPHRGARHRDLLLAERCRCGSTRS